MENRRLVGRINALKQLRSKSQSINVKIKFFINQLIEGDFDNLSQLFGLQNEPYEIAKGKIISQINQALEELTHAVSSYGICTLSGTYEGIKGRPVFKLGWANLNNEHHSLERDLKTRIIHCKLKTFKGSLANILPFLRDSVYNLQDGEFENYKNTYCLNGTYFITEKGFEILSKIYSINGFSGKLIRYKALQEIEKIKSIKAS